MAKAHVILFKESGKYYTEEEWEIPTSVKVMPNSGNPRERSVFGPYDMDQSPDFRRIGGGAVLVVTQEPWGYPHLFPKVEIEYITESEHDAMDLTTKLWDILVQEVVMTLGPTTQEDLRELAVHIHGIQNRIMGQAAARAYPDKYRLLGDSLRPITES